MLQILGNRKITLARELTKTFEEYSRGTIEEILLDLPQKGEMVLIVEGFKEEAQIEEPFKRIDELISLGYKPNEAIKEIAKLMQKSRSELYKAYIEYKNIK
jgi:16S rRNA (cytidine1402-2'-O)-methyltransferase